MPLPWNTGRNQSSTPATGANSLNRQQNRWGNPFINLWQNNSDPMFDPMLHSQLARNTARRAADGQQEQSASQNTARRNTGRGQPWGASQHGMNMGRGRPQGNSPQQSMNMGRGQAQSGSPQQSMNMGRGQTQGSPTQQSVNMGNGQAQRGGPPQNVGMSQQQTKSGLPNLVPGGLENPFGANLPDGVRLQPLNDETLKQIRAGVTPPVGSTPTVGQNIPALSAMPAAPAAAMPTIPVAPPVAPNPLPVSESLPSGVISVKDFIQGESNASRFYSQLSKFAPHEGLGEMLRTISARAARRRDMFSGIYMGVEGAEFTPSEASFPSDMSFYEGVRLAALEENSMLRGLAELLEQTADHAAARTLNSQIFGKISDINTLQHILSQKK